jgi:hypothetical protein
MLNHQTLIHNNNQTSTPSRLSSLLINYSKLHPNHKRLTIQCSKFNGLFYYQRNVLCWPENVNDFDGFLDFRRNIKQVLVTFLAKNSICKWIYGYNAVSMLSFPGSLDNPTIAITVYFFKISLI